ncbi:hypothetical protein C1H46_039348 [Malus baccata]|uniref:Uncharacterized protein n=1 Tax=Malus baccata TaxID=106549 RepID=A0A540KLQ3_MALBA|nr:hypothetical protein C1H46_039348 [Malus baccata]
MYNLCEKRVKLQAMITTKPYDFNHYRVDRLAENPKLPRSLLIFEQDQTHKLGAVKNICPLYNIIPRVKSSTVQHLTSHNG